MLPLYAAVIALLLLGAQRPEPLVQSIDVTFRLAPVAFRQSGATQLVHELHITNFQQADATIRAVAVQDADGRELARYADSQLAQRITRPGLRNDYPTPQVIGPGMRAIVHVWMATPPDAPFVSRIAYTVDLDITRNGAVLQTQVKSRAVPVTPMFGSEIDAPLRGGPWIAIYDPLLKGGHRTAMYTLNGRVSIPGRFAIDFIALPPAGAVPAQRAPDANGFGAEVLAVADGTIAIAVDGVVDATPPPITLELAPGNHVAIDLGRNRFAFYEHLQRGSVRVKVGDRVTRGQVIAQLGSSGSSSIGPHLHFHVADAASTLAAEGVPFVFRQFTQVGSFASLTSLTSGEKWLPASSAVSRQLERPDPVSVVHFP
jgi:murein DD-endopeptidase